MPNGSLIHQLNGTTFDAVVFVHLIHLAEIIFPGQVGEINLICALANSRQILYLMTLNRTQQDVVGQKITKNGGQLSSIRV